MNSLNGDGDSLDEANSLDHVLLESLFYNEMALMDDFSNSLFSASMMNGFSASSDTDGSVGSTTLQDNGVPQVALVPEDPKVDVEKDLLRDFGIAHPIVAPSVVQNPPPPTEASPSRKVPFVPPPIDKVQQQLNLKLASSRGIRHNVTVPLATPLQQQQQQQHQQPALAAAPPRPPPVSEEEMRKKLVIQFATLAGRLGITLPPQVVQKLTNKVVTGIAVPATLSVAPPDAMATAITLAPVPSSTVPSPTVTTSAVASLSAVAPPVAPPVIQQLQSTAVEAIAVVSGKRAAFAVEDGKPYSKRRKKPRLSDCERKLAELQAENSLLKSHLDNIANQNHNLDQERIKAETQMRAMLQESAPDAQLDPVVQNFTEMYSDYGRKRHEELNFHLEQLQRLANPTNFTKMGLWTLGGQSSNKDRGNPIAGMLQKELGISAQQGRKILDQRQKIQKVCLNLKECLVLLGKLKALCEQKTKIFHDRMTKCREILTPKQVVKLLIWIDENSNTLGSVCPGWGSEQFQSKTTKNQQS